MTKALQIKTTGEVIELDLSGKDSLDVLQGAVGGWVQAVPLATDLSLWVNEEGKYNGLPHNPHAQFMWDKVYGAQTDYIVGDIVLTGGADDEGETIALTAEQVAVIEGIVRKVKGYTEPRAEVIAS